MLKKTGLIAPAVAAAASRRAPALVRAPPMAQSARPRRRRAPVRGRILVEGLKPPPPSPALREARQHLLQHGYCPPGAIDERLARSWQRSAAAGLMPAGRLLEPEHVFLDVDAEPAQVDQRVGDDLTEIGRAHV